MSTPTEKEVEIRKESFAEFERFTEWFTNESGNSEEDRAFAAWGCAWLTQQEVINDRDEIINYLLSRLKQHKAISDELIEELARRSFKHE